jgi:hypothetical protein
MTARRSLRTEGISISHNVLLPAQPTKPVFGKARCKICGDKVRLAIKHLNDKHPELMAGDKSKESLQKLVEKYFT